MTTVRGKLVGNIKSIISASKEPNMHSYHLKPLNLPFVVVSNSVLVIETEVVISLTVVVVLKIVLVVVL